MVSRQAKPSEMPKGDQLTVQAVRRILSAAEDQTFKERIDRAEKTLEDLKGLLTHAPILRNGKLSTGTIEYAAFRVQTLSLIFELARRSLRRALQGSDAAYDSFLSDLGDEVGLTFARDLMARLIAHDLLLPFQDMHKILDLWASFENDTGAGETRITHYSSNDITIQLKNNPLRKAETTKHAHCGFYRSYIASLINEMFTIRARFLRENVEGATVQAQTIFAVEERPDTDDHCVFHLQCRPEKLIRAFDLLSEVQNNFYKLEIEDDYSNCMAGVRGALVNAQMEAIGISDERAPRNLHTMYKGLIPNHLIKQMDETYQRASKALHGEAKTKVKLERKQAWSILTDARRCIYALELLDLTEAEKTRLRDEAATSARLKTIEELVEKAKDLTPDDRQIVRNAIAHIKNRTELSDEGQLALVNILRKGGTKLWEISRPILSDILTAAIKKQLGLD